MRFYLLPCRFLSALVTAGLALALLTTSMTAAAEITIDESAAKLWVKSDSGPRWGQTFELGDKRFKQVDDILTVDLSGLEEEGFKMAVLTLALSEPQLEAGQSYTVSLEAKSSNGASSVLLMPEDSGEKDPKGEAKPKSQWFRAGGDWPEVSETFTFDPAVGEGHIKFFFTGKQAGNVYEFRSLTVEPRSDGSEPK